MILPPLDQLAVYNNADNETKDIIEQCYEATKGVDLSTRANLSCASYGYSLMATFYNGAVCKFHASFTPRDDASDTAVIEINGNK